MAWLQRLTAYSFVSFCLWYAHDAATDDKACVRLLALLSNWKSNLHTVLSYSAHDYCFVPTFTAKTAGMQHISACAQQAADLQLWVHCCMAEVALLSAPAHTTYPEHCY